MTDNTPDRQDSPAPGKASRRKQLGILAVVCALVIGIYGAAAHTGPLDGTSPHVAADSTYNLLVQGFRDGQLSLKKEVPPGFAKLPDPFDSIANMPYRELPDRLLDLSYYKGRFYIYFGVVPALLLFWPYAALTGHYLLQSTAVVIFCASGFLASVSLLWCLWRRYFPALGFGVVLACTLALGLGTGTLVMLARADVYAVAISCGSMLTLLTLGALWRAIHEPEKRGRWLLLASLCYGLALGARPDLLFGAIILLAPIVLAWREGRPIGGLLLMATGPIVCIGLGLLLYNYRRFGRPSEFGIHYLIGGGPSINRTLFRPRYLWTNFQIYFLEPMRWTAHFPFVQENTAVSIPTGHYWVDDIASGMLANFPLVWLTLAVPLAWYNRPAAVRHSLNTFLTTVALYVWAVALPLLCLHAANHRYAIDFLPVLMLLVVGGILGVERALAGRPRWRRVARWGWGCLLSVSVAVSLLANAEQFAKSENYSGYILEQVGRYPEAISHLERALRYNPYLPDAHRNLGVVLMDVGESRAALEQWEEALRINPNYVPAHLNLAAFYMKMGQFNEAIAHYELALRIRPELAEVHSNLGVALMQVGRTQDALEHWEAAVRINPDYAKAHYKLGLVLTQLGRFAEAIDHFEQALRIQPTSAECHYFLGVALERAGRLPEATRQYVEALRIQPNFAEAQSSLQRLRSAQ